MPDSAISPIRWQDNQLILLDQRLLPDQTEELICETLEQTAQAISDLVVRGAPAIGITAAYGVVLGYRQAQADPDYDLDQALDLLIRARPTAVNLAWAVNQQRKLMQTNDTDLDQALLDNARSIHQQDLADNQRMGDFGAELIKPASKVLTHCNAGALATAGFGTALGVIRSAWSQGKLEQVYASETRPWLQGMRLTVWELAHDNIDVSLIVEAAASSLLSQHAIDWVIVGADRVCANGDVVNKIGTANLAIMARHYGVSLMVVAPLSTIDLQMQSGDQVAIEQRSSEEILGQHYADDPRVSVWNPVFDVTPAHLVTALVTEKGVILQPDKEKIADLFEAK